LLQIGNQSSTSSLSETPPEQELKSPTYLEGGPKNSNRFVATETNENGSQIRPPAFFKSGTAHPVMLTRPDFPRNNGRRRLVFVNAPNVWLLLE
jgi:hypothetical protein